MNDGYIKIYRKMIDTSFYKNPKMTHFAMHCLLRANHKPAKIVFNKQELELQKGEFISGLYNLNKETGLSVQSIRTCIQILSNIGFLTSRTTNRFTIFKVEKYDFYQFGNGKATSKVTIKQQTNNNQTTTDNNDKNDKNEKNTIKDTLSEKIVNHLYSCILKEKPDFKKPNLNPCLIEADRMIRIDNRNPDTIIKIIDFATSDDFWKTNILSVNKLRKQFDKLELQANKAKSGLIKKW